MSAENRVSLYQSDLHTYDVAFAPFSYRALSHPRRHGAIIRPRVSKYDVDDFTG